MMGMDQGLWDWKPAATDFMPSATAGMLGAGFQDSCGPFSFPVDAAQHPGEMPPHGGFPGPFSTPFCSGSGNTMPPLLAASFGPAGCQPVPGGMGGLMGPLGPHAAVPPRSLFAPSGSMGWSPDFRTNYEIEIQTKDQKLRELQHRLRREEGEKAMMQQEFERDREGLLQHLNQLMTVVERHGIPVESSHRTSPEEVPRSKLDSQMAQLGNLLHSNQEPSSGRGGGGKGGKLSVSAGGGLPPGGPGAVGKGFGKSGLGLKGPGGGCFGGNGIAASIRPEDGARGGGGGGSGFGGPCSRPDVALAESSGRSAGQCTAASGSIGSGQSCLATSSSSGASRGRFRVSFPSDLTQTHSADEDDSEEAQLRHRQSELDRAIRSIERRAGNPIDQPARKAVEQLDYESAREALRRVADLVHDAGGQCTNLSALVQTICQKIVLRRGSTTSAGASSSQPEKPALQTALKRSGSAAGAEPIGQADAGRRHSHSVRDGRSGSVEDNRRCGDGSQGVPTSAHVPAAAPGAVGEPIGQKEDHRLHVGAPPKGVAWSSGRFERLARQGAFDLKQSPEGAWELGINMCEVEPPFSDEAMQVYCPWLHRRLHRVREECGLRSLRQLQAGVNFPRNGLCDDAVARLLQALERSELHVTMLNLFANCIGPQGARQIGEFVRCASFSMHELNLAYNKVDDAAAIELIRLILQHPKVQMRQSGDGRLGGSHEVPMPMVLRLNNNWIRDPLRVLRKVESDRGVWVSHAQTQQPGGPTFNGWLHLHRFCSQDQPPPSLPEAHEGGARRRHCAERRQVGVPTSSSSHRQLAPQCGAEGARQPRRSGSGRSSARSGGVVALPRAGADGLEVFAILRSPSTSQSAKGGGPGASKGSDLPSPIYEDEEEEAIPVALVAIPESPELRASESTDDLGQEEGDAEEPPRIEPIQPAMQSASCGAPERTPEPDSQPEAAQSSSPGGDLDPSPPEGTVPVAGCDEGDGAPPSRPPEPEAPAGGAAPEFPAKAAKPRILQRAPPPQEDCQASTPRAALSGGPLSETVPLASPPTAAGGDAPAQMASQAARGGALGGRSARRGEGMRKSADASRPSQRLLTTPAKILQRACADEAFLAPGVGRH